jgi:hypothetical protein
MMMNGSQMKQYSTDGTTDVFMFGVFAAPIGAKPGSGEVREIHAVGSQPPDGTPVSGGFTAGAPVTAAPDGEASDKPFVAHFVRAAKNGNGKEDVEENVIVFGDQCPEPKRTGEATVAGRAVLVIENDFSTCLPANAPVKLPARHIRWVDKTTYLPLKMEAYDKSGKLVDRYEVTSIEYDVLIADKTFTELPSGTTERELKMPPLKPGGQVVGPGVPTSKPKTP